MDFKDYYKTLGVPRTASADDIKKAFRQLARKHHPDINKEAGAEAKFKEINEANDVLSDPEKRKAYDELGPDFQQGQNFRPPPGWAEQHEFRARANPRGGASEHDFSDFFEELFGARAQRGGTGFSQRRGPESFQARGEDSHARIMVDLRDSFTGAERQISLRVPEIDGDRIVTRSKVLSVKIPKGLVTGQVIRLKGQGGPGLGGAPAGDLYLEVELASDALYRVDGRDLYLELPVAPWEAALGASVKTPTPAGAIMLKIPPNSASGRELRVKSRGIPAAEPGDLHVVLKIVLPAADTVRARELYEQMARDLAFDPRADMGS